MLAFLEMPVEEQAALVRRVYEAATQEQMAALVKSARDEQRRREGEGLTAVIATA